jgi:hypothetical protein
VLSLGSEFTIDGNNALRLSSLDGRIASTGWVVQEVREDFTCVPTVMYFVYPPTGVDIVATIPPGWLRGDQVCVVNRNPSGGVIIQQPAGFTQVEEALNLVCDGEDNFFRF